MKRNGRTYNCKDEELIPICNYVAFNLRRDLAEFKTFSAKFDSSYAKDYEAKIAEANEILNAKSVTTDLKDTTEKLYAAIAKALDLANRTEAFVRLTNKAIPATDFGLSVLRKKARSRDAEGTVQAMKITLAAINKHHKALTAQGMSEAYIQDFESTMNSIAADNQRQYEIISIRKGLVEKNLLLFNDLYFQMSNICKIGKILFKGNAIKVQEYTFTELKKKVRIVVKEKKEEE